VELTYLDNAGFRNSNDSIEVARQFCNAVRGNSSFHLKSFLNEMLKSTVGNEKADQIQAQIQQLLERRDPFMAIRSIDSHTIASLLEKEHPQTTAVVLSELPPKKSSEVLGMLGEGVRLSTISRMTGSEAVTAEAKTRIAKTLRNRLGSVTGGGARKQSLRKVAVILRNLGKDLQNGLVSAIKEKDRETSYELANLMVVWEDITHITDRTLQEALRNIYSGKLALALVRADKRIGEKIKSNLSERAAVAVDEETSLMSWPNNADIQEARGEVVAALRKMNEKGKLAFIEE